MCYMTDILCGVLRGSLTHLLSQNFISHQLIWRMGSNVFCVCGISGNNSSLSLPVFAFPKQTDRSENFAQNLIRSRQIENILEPDHLWWKCFGYCWRIQFPAETPSKCVGSSFAPCFREVGGGWCFSCGAAGTWRSAVWAAAVLIWSCSQMVAYLAYLLNCSCADPDSGNTMPSDRHEFTLHSDGKLRRMGFTAWQRCWFTPELAWMKNSIIWCSSWFLISHHTGTPVCVCVCFQSFLGCFVLTEFPQFNVVQFNQQHILLYKKPTDSYLRQDTLTHTTRWIFQSLTRFNFQDRTNKTKKSLSSYIRGWI